jgi:hypothetical protein
VPRASGNCVGCVKLCLHVLFVPGMYSIWLMTRVDHWSAGSRLTARQQADGRRPATSSPEVWPYQVIGHVSQIATGFFEMRRVHAILSHEGNTFWNTFTRRKHVLVFTALSLTHALHVQYTAVQPARCTVHSSVHPLGRRKNRRAAMQLNLNNICECHH